MWKSNKSRFIWLYGVLGFGLALSLTTIISDFPKRSGEHPYWWVEATVLVISSLIFNGLLAGYIWGWIMWHFLKRLKKHWGATPPPGGEG